MTALDALQEHLGHRFADPTLLERALTHSSFAHEHHTRANERLEFLGDAILQASMTILLFQRFPSAPEGELSRYRSRLVNTEILAGLGAELAVGEALLLGRGENQSGGRTKISLLADATEAVLGALFLDAGFGPCLDVVSKLMASRLETLHDVIRSEGAGAWKDPRSRLQERTQRRWQRAPTYEVAAQQGPAHEPVFEVEARLDDLLLGRGRGGSKREAMRAAAVDALERLPEED